VKNRSQESALAESIIARRNFKTKFRMSQNENLRQIISFSGISEELSVSIIDRRETEFKTQPEKITDSLESVKEQMMVRDNFKPEFFLRELELVEDEIRFGFTNSYKSSRFKRFKSNMSFGMTSKRFFDYFENKLSVPDEDISEFARKEE